MRRAVCFDIDGVLLRGGAALPGARAALLALHVLRIPFVLMTNGGGMPERVRAEQVATALAAPVPLEWSCDADRLTASEVETVCSLVRHDGAVVLSHTPLQSLVEGTDPALLPPAQIVDASLAPAASPAEAAAFSAALPTLTLPLARQRLLLMGHGRYCEVAQEYGFERVTTVTDLLRRDPTRYPFPHSFLPDERAFSGEGRGAEERTAEGGGNGDAIAAIAILHDPINWAPELQVALDILSGSGGGVSPSVQRVPLIATNADFVFSGRHATPRLAAGAFTHTLAALWRRLHPAAAPLHVHQFGKPETVQYHWVQHLLERAAASASAGEGAAAGGALERIYMVGDNPEADIAGANRAGAPWHSILVESGVFAPRLGALNDPRHPAKTVVPTVLDAVEFIAAQK